MKTLIIGNGEIGKSLKNVLEKRHDVSIRDIRRFFIRDVEVLHICYPYSKTFIHDTKNYIEYYQPDFAVIHSTVPVGTSKKCGAYHSPVRGVHPNLETALKTFVKYLAPKNQNLTNYFKKAGIPIKQVEKTETTELAKILSTTKYGLDIIFNKEAYRAAKKLGADFDIAYTDFTKTYNEGYVKLKQTQYTRPVLKYMKGKIGGHCVIQNCKLLKSYITDLIQKKNG